MPAKSVFQVKFSNPNLTCGFRNSIFYDTVTCPLPIKVSAFTFERAIACL